MRAVISARVGFIPASRAGTERAPPAGPERSRFATRSEIRRAFGAAGLTPPPLVRFRSRRSADEDRDERTLFRDLATVVGDAARKREHIAPDDLLVADDSRLDGTISSSTEAAAQESEHYGDENRDVLAGLAALALPVLTRMPARSGEDRDRRREAADSLLFVSTLNPTRTLFIVSMENEGAITFRLHHPLIERLKRGCENLVERFSDPVPVEGGWVRVDLEGPIEIYEVGQEDATIMGHLVGTSFTDRVRYAFDRDRASYAAFGVLLMIFIGLLAVLLVSQDQTGLGDAIVSVRGTQYVRHQADFWHGQAERLQSGVVPVLLVTTIALIIRFPRGLVVQWKQGYGQ